MLLAGLATLVASPSGAQVPLTLDTSFRCIPVVYPGLSDALPLVDGSVVITGWFGLTTSYFSSWVVKLLPDGSLDAFWGINGGGGGDIHPSGPYYYASGSHFPSRFIQATGELDYGFRPNSVNYPYPGLLFLNNGGIIVQADGKVLFTGDHQLNNPYGPNTPGYYSLLRLNTDGTLDSTYQYRRTDGVIWTIEPTTQGRFLLSGVYSTYEGEAAGRILRIWPDGSLDSTFHSDIIKGYAKYLLEQADGRIIAGGQFVFPNEPDTMHLIRLMPDGALDASFNNHAEYKLLPQLSFGDFSFGVHVARQLGDGTIIVGGSFTHIDGQLRRGIALLDSTGHLLNTAFTGEGCGLTHDFNDPYLYSGISSITPAPDGSIFLAGAFHGFDDGTVSDTAQRMICKLRGLSLGVGVQTAPPPAWQPQVYPNPGTDLLHISTGIPGKATVRLLDSTGRIVKAKRGGEAIMQLDCGDLAPGLYVVEVQTQVGRQTVKWTKR